MCFPKCEAGYSGLGPICYSTCPSGWTDDVATCRRAGYCDNNNPDHQGALCYPQCKPGYYGSLNICYASCPAGYSNGPTYCGKPDSYGRGGGYPWKFSDGLNDHKQFDRCNKDNPQGCEKSGAIVYPKCKAGLHAVGCYVCLPDCPAGFNDTGATCEKPRYDCGVGVPDTTIVVKQLHGRGVGTPAVSIRAKKRIVPFSTKKIEHVYTCIPHRRKPQWC